MHFELLVEDKSGSIAVGILLEKILGTNNADHSWRIHPYRGLGRLPKGLGAGADASRRILLDRLPQLLRGYGRSLDPAQSCVVVVVDADKRDCVLRTCVLAVMPCASLDATGESSRNPLLPRVSVSRCCRQGFSAGALVATNTRRSNQ